MYRLVSSITCVAIALAVGGCDLTSSASAASASQATSASQPTETERRAQSQPATSLARDAVPQLPTPQEVIERFIDVTGGRQARTKVRNMMILARQRATLRLARETIGGTATHYEDASGRFLTETRTDRFVGSSGSDGKTVWEIGPMGPRIIAEYGKIPNDQRLFPEMHFVNDFEKIAVVGSVMVRGEPAYQLAMTDADGKKIEVCFSMSTGLFIMKKYFCVEPLHPDGGFVVQEYYSDYRMVAELRLPHMIQYESVPQDIVVTVVDVQVDVDIPNNRFELPPDIKALRP